MLLLIGEVVKHVYIIFKAKVFGNTSWLHQGIPEVFKSTQ